MYVDENVLRDILRLFVWYPLRWIIIILPFRAEVQLLSLMGDIHYFLSRGKKRMLRDNLSRMKASVSADESAIRKYFRNYYIDRLLIFAFPGFGSREVKRFVKIRGLDNLNEALKNRKGVVLVHGHFGPVHLPLVSLARNGYKIKQIGNPTDEGLSWIGRNVAFRLRMVYEKKIPAEIVKADSYLRPVFKWLKRNGIIMVTGDGSGTERQIGRHAPFLIFGHKIMFPLGPSLLSEKTGAALLPMFIVPARNKLYEIIIEDPLKSERKGNEKVLDITGQFIRQLENYIALYPGYMHFLDRFHSGALII